MASLGKICKSKTHSWIIDSGASDFMTYHGDVLLHYESFTNTKRIRITNGVSLQVIGKGMVTLS